MTTMPDTKSAQDCSHTDQSTKSGDASEVRLLKEVEITDEISLALGWSDVTRPDY